MRVSAPRGDRTALAQDISKSRANSKNLPNSKQVANVKGDKVPPKEAAASVAVHHIWPEAPIVMGRSVSLHHKTKLHHVRVKPLVNGGDKLCQMAA